MTKYLASILLCFCFSINGAESPADAFQAANKLYYENKFAEAASTYEKLIHSGHRAPSLYFNLGNAWFKSGQLGRAITAYCQAERLTPRDPDVRANLQFARNQTQGPSLPPDLLQRWLGKIALDEWTLLAAGSIWLWCLLVAALQFQPAWKRSMRGLLTGLAVASIALCGCLAATLYENRAVQTAVVITPEAVVRRGPLEESQNAFAVHDGAELRVLDRKDDWLLVTTDPRRTGWLRRDQVLLPAR
jgi:tetratricopeptide (TPR) repeat protein